MQDNPNYSYIHTIIDDSGNTHYIKDAEARNKITDLETSKQDALTPENKLPASNISGLSNVATSGSYNDLSDKPSVDATMSDSSTNAVQNKTIKQYVDSQIGSIGSVLRIKGTKQSQAEILAITSAKTGDMWINAEDNSEWFSIQDISVATPAAWEKLGFTIDLSAYELKANLKALAYKDNASASYTPAGNVTVNAYTPEGTVTAPTLNVEANTTTVNSITDVGTLPELTMSVANQTLTFSFNQGTLPTKGSDTTVATGIKTATASQPVFTGTAKAPTGSFAGTSATITAS